MINPGWIHEIMFLLVREFEKDNELVDKHNLKEIIEDYRLYYSIAGDVFEDPTSFDEIIGNNPQLYAVFDKTLKEIKKKLLEDKNFLTVKDLDGKVDIGVVRYGNDIQLEKLIGKIEEVEALLKT